MQNQDVDYLIDPEIEHFMHDNDMNMYIEDEICVQDENLEESISCQDRSKEGTEEEQDRRNFRAQQDIAERIASLERDISRLEKDRNNDRAQQDMELEIAHEDSSSSDQDENDVLKDKHYIKKNHRKIDLYINEKSMHVLQYIGGRISQKFGNKYAELRGKANSSHAWINAKNEGNLFHPSHYLMANLEKMEHKFRLFHGHTVDKDPNPNERLVEYILADCQVPKCVADFFVKCRIRQRIKILNTKHLQPRRDIRALKQLGQFQN